MASTFVGMTSKKVAALQAADTAVNSIQLQSERITFSWLRESFKENNGLKDNLKYGTAILSGPAELDQYLYTYGKMIQSQWAKVLKGMNVSDEPVRIIDYGCGQGLAGLIIADRLGDRFVAKVKEVTLIEPSEAALVRAEAVFRNLFPTTKIKCLCEKLDDVSTDEFAISEIKTLHIFSNVLDVPGFDPASVFNKTLTNGRHTILAVSHDRNFAGGTARIEAIKKEMEKKKHSSWMTINTSEVEKFNCGDGNKFAAIRWVADLTVHHE